MRVRFCQDDFELPSGDFQRLRPSDYERDGLNSLRQRLEEDGYLYLKGFLDRDDVLRARQAILNYMDAHEGLEPGSRPLDGVMGVSGKSVRMAGQRPVTHDPAVRAVLESSRLFDFYQQLYGGPVKTFDYKWMRAVGNDEATGCHMDHVYMGRGSKRVMTCWVPFDDIPIERGTLAVCPGSHAAAAFARLRETYGQMDIDRDRISDGWFSKHPAR
ncbi:MAG: phytanoyl-CoA dioxygenase family protein [Planctomycetota bacterium]